MTFQQERRAMSAVTSEVSDLAATVAAFRFHYGDEDQLQRGLAGALTSAGGGPRAGGRRLMLFREELAEMIVAGEKTATRRLPKDNPRSPWWWKGCRYKVGYDFPVMGGFHRPAFCRAIVDRVALERLGAVSHDQACEEGFESIDAFLAKIREINGPIESTAWVWVVEFHVKPGSHLV